MSCGSFCMSPSMRTTISPRLLSIPACTAAVWPKLRRKLTTRTCGSWSASSAIFPVPPARLPAAVDPGRGHLPGAPVAAAVVDVHDLVRELESLENSAELIVQRRDALGFV